MNVDYKLFNMKFYFSVMLFLTFQVNALQAQKIDGQVINSVSGKPVPFVNISVVGSNMGICSDKNGMFSLDVAINNIIGVSAVGYEPKRLVVANIDSLVIELSPKRYRLDQVEVVEEDLNPLIYRSDVYPDKEPNLLNAVVQPLSFLYYKCSKREKSKRKVRDLIENERKMAGIYRIYNKDLIAEYTGFSGRKLDSCLIFCNAHINLTARDAEFMIKRKLLEVLADYNRQNH